MIEEVKYFFFFYDKIEIEKSDIMGLLDIFRRKNDVVNNTVNTNNINESFQPVVDEYGRVSNEFIIDDVSTISGRGTVVVGQVVSGIFRVGDNVSIPEMGINTIITGIEMFRRSLDQAVAGDNAGFLLRGVNRDQVQRGNKIVK